MEPIQTAINDILLDYQKGRDIDILKSGLYPNKATVIDLTQKLLRVIFPAYAPGDPEMLLQDAVTLLRRLLGEEQVTAFLKQIPSLRAVAQTDVEAAFEGDPAATGSAEIISCYPGLHAITVYRLAHELHRMQIPMLPRIMTEFAHSATGIDIHPGAVIGKYFFIDHGTGIVIGETTVIGEHVKIYQGVTLGGLSTRGGQSLRGVKRHPTIEDNVTIYANASILGGDTVIGRNSVIGASAFITESIPPCSTVTNKSQDLQIKSRCRDCPIKE